jgi:hypothetical protein
VLDFQRGPATRNYLSRREQGRLLLLVTTLGLVILLALEARDPANFAWLWAIRHEGDGAAEATVAAERPSGAATGAERFAGVQADLLDDVRDDFPFLYGERDAWFHLLAVLRDTDAAVLRGASMGRVTYVQMFEQPDVYRGRLLTVQGMVRRVERWPAPKNDLGFDHYYRTWITPQDSPSNLLVVYCLSLPAGFPIGTELEEPVELAGFFFKRWVYQAQDKLRTAPVVLSGSLVWQPQPQAVERRVRDDPLSVAIIVVIAALFAASATACVYYRNRGGKRREAGGSFDGRLMEPLTVRPPPEQSLQSLAREEKASDE